MSHQTQLIDALCALGFTTYEARTYTGLLENYSQTAYGLSKVTGVPQPKIYEVLRKLEARGAAVLVSTDPQKFAATPPQEILTSLRVEFESRMKSADHAVTVAVSENKPLTQAPKVMTGLSGKATIMAAASQLLAEATDKVYLSAWVPELFELELQINRASNNGVFFVTLGFGQGKVQEPNGHFYRHWSTLKTLYHHHQNRHFALVADGNTVLWATYVDDVGWTGLLARDRRLVGLVRTYIRHDIYVQKIYARFGPELMETFGAGLELLTNVNQDLVMTDASIDSVAIDAAVSHSLAAKILRNEDAS